MRTPGSCHRERARGRPADVSILSTVGPKFKATCRNLPAPALAVNRPVLVALVSLDAVLGAQLSPDCRDTLAALSLLFLLNWDLGPHCRRSALWHGCIVTYQPARTVGAAVALQARMCGVTVTQRPWNDSGHVPGLETWALTSFQHLVGLRRPLFHLESARRSEGGHPCEPGPGWG